MASKTVSISFDELNRVRLMPPDDFKASEKLAEECGHFVERISQFTQRTQTLVDILKTHSDHIEREKLMAIGQRNRIEAEQESRKRRQQELQFLIAQKQAELQQLQDYHASLQKIEQDQNATIQKLRN